MGLAQPAEPRALVVREELGPEELARRAAERQAAAEELGRKLDHIQASVPAGIANTQGSVAGSGSGSFHQYRQQRRRDQFRQMALEAEQTKEDDARAFAARQAAREGAAAARTSKKRDKRKAKKLKAQAAKRRKAGGGAAPPPLMPGLLGAGGAKAEPEPAGAPEGEPELAQAELD